MSAPKIAFVGLNTSPYASVWKNPDLSFSKVLGYYALGMIEYACKTATRVGGLVKDFFLLIFYELGRACYKKDVTHLWDRIKSVGRDLPEIAIALLGCFCPPLAYEFDEALFDTTSHCYLISYKMVVVRGVLCSTRPSSTGGPLMQYKDPNQPIWVDFVPQESR